MEAPNRPEKIRVVDSILRGICVSGARFAKLDSATQRWYELNDVQAHQKIGHAIRDTIRLNRKQQSGSSSSNNNNKTSSGGAMIAASSAKSKNAAAATRKGNNNNSSS